MARLCWTRYGCVAIALAGIGIASPVAAQIIPDTTLPQNAIVTPNGSTFTIDGGTSAKTNLFHSFSEFSVLTGTEAFFNNAVSIENIITRVTGGNISSIDGLIRANGSANLFLLNPNGIFFGENASLDIGGSFLASSADSLVFADGNTFSTLEGDSSPLLTVSTPVGLQLGTNPGEIRVTDIGHNLIFDFSIFGYLENTNPGLQVAPNRTLALVGGEVNLDGGILNALMGRIELGGVVNTTVGITSVSDGFSLVYDENANFMPVRLSQTALAEVRGEGGSIRVRGQSLRLADGSILLVLHEGSQLGGSIDVTVTDLLEVTGFYINPLGNMEPTTIGLEVREEGDGDRIDISASNVVVENLGSIVAFNTGDGKSGDVNIVAAEEVRVAAISSNPELTAFIGANTFGLGDGGDLRVVTQRVMIEGGSSIQVSSSSRGGGDGGNLIINASESVEVIGTTPDLRGRSGVFANTTGPGDAGSIAINTQRVVVRGGAVISGSTFAEGDAASIAIDASESVEILDSPNPDVRSAISSSAFLQPPALREFFGLPDFPTGNAGSVVVRTPNLTVDNANLAVFARGPGDAGILAVEAQNLRIDDTGLIGASTISGEGGNITLNISDSLSVRGGSEISAEAGGAGNGGNLSIDTGAIALIENSIITANAFEGNGGNIDITAEGIFLSPNSAITASSQLGVDGIVEITNPEVDTQAGLIELANDPLEGSDRVATGCGANQGNSFIIAGVRGIPENPNQPLRGTTVWEDLRPLEVGGVREVERKEENLESTIDDGFAIVEATSWQRNDGGEIELVAARSRLATLPSHSHCQ